MKINWGTGILISFALFMSFILFFVYKVQSDHKYDNELVNEEYYKKEATVQNDIAKEHNANNLNQRVTINTNNAGVLVQFPKNIAYQNIKGIISFYRPSNKKLDFTIPIALSNSDLLIPKKSLLGGLWDISIEWNVDNTSYLDKKEIYIE